MSTGASTLPERQQAVLDRFVAACEADDRVVAAILGGSYARGAADEYSDLDLSLITTDAAYEEFRAGREAFIRRLGEPLFVETFNDPHVIFFILADGTECELGAAPESAFTHIQSGPYIVLVDKRGIVDGAGFSWSKPDPAEQRETLRRQIAWFWHDLSHFTAAIARGQLWWAYGQLEILRLACVNLARLRQNFSAEADGYEKVEQAVPVAQLSPLPATCCPLERGAMLHAALIIVRFYRDLAPHLARTHGIPYPDHLDRVISDRLENLCNAGVHSENVERDGTRARG